MKEIDEDIDDHHIIHDQSGGDAIRVYCPKCFEKYKDMMREEIERYFQQQRESS